MTMRTITRHAPLIAAAIALLAPLAQAQQDEIRVTAEISARTVYLGESLTLQVAVEGHDDPGEPSLPDVDGVSFESLGGGSRSSSFVTTFNGRRREVNRLAYVFQYAITPTREGSFRIPPISVPVDGRTYTTEPVTVSAIEPPIDPESEIRIELEAASAYVGQPVRTRVLWFFEGRADSVSFRASDLPPALDVLPLPPANAAGRRTYRVSAFGRDLEAIETQAVLDGRTRPALAFELMLIPRAPGEYTVGPAVVSFDRITRRTQRRMSRSNTPALVVDPLPSEGRPPNFTGLIGEFSLGLSASPTDVNVGDPITLELTIRGPEPLSGVDAPDLAADPDLAERFKPSADGWERAGQDRVGQRAFETTIRARSADVEAIPPIRLPYFDPVSGGYRFAQTEPIPIEVRRTRRVTAADAITAPGRTPPASSRDPERARDGVWALQTDPARLLASDALDMGDWATRPTTLTLLAAPPAAYMLASVVVFARRRSDPAATARKRARRRAGSLLASGRAPDAVRAWAAGVTGHPEQTIVAGDVLALGNEAARADAALLAGVLLTGERERFGAEPPPAPADAAQIRAAMRRVERHAPNAEDTR